jgi:hypothetical protein
MRLCALTRCNSRIRQLRPPSVRPSALPTAGAVPPVVRVEEDPNLLPDLRRDRAAIEALVAEGRLSLVSAEGAMGMDGACDGFPAPGGIPV